MGAGVPPSIAYLSQLDQLIVKQKKELMESKFRSDANTMYDYTCLFPQFGCLHSIILWLGV